MGDVFDDNSLPCILLEVALDVVFLKIDVPCKTVVDHDPLSAVLALPLDLGDLDTVDQLP